MDWSLALASQEIAAVIHAPHPGGGAWALEVDARDASHALRVLRLYHVENRRRPSPLTPAVGELIFHWGVLAWCLLLILVHQVAAVPGSPVTARGIFDTTATAHGDWWRPLTATFLHSSPEHLAANLTTGFLLLGLAMGRLGTGPALFLGLLAGTGGNLLAWAFRPRAYLGLGASGVVMGALGILAFTLLLDARQGRVSRGTVLRGILGGVLLFILFGTSPNSDVLAHAGGFACGATLAALSALIPVRASRSAPWDLATALAYLALSAIAWIAALRPPA